MKANLEIGIEIEDYMQALDEVILDSDCSRETKKTLLSLWSEIATLADANCRYFGEYKLNKFQFNQLMDQMGSRKIECIKLIQAFTGIGLIEAKDAVERYAEENNISWS